jgi:hypothetical protein
MPSISVSLDGKELACVQTEGYDIVSVCVSGTRIEDEFAEIYMSASSYPDAGESTYLIWLNSVPIQPGQVVEVNITEDGETSGTGQTLDELFPNEVSSDREEFKVTEEMFTELRTRAPNRPGYRLEANLSTGSAVSAQTAPDEHGFGFNVLWSSHGPERASVSLHTYTIDNMALRTPMKYHLNEHLNPGQSASVKVDA